MLSHAVYFTLKDRTPDAAATLIASCQKHLTGHAGEVGFWVGTCAAYDRHVNDRDWDVMLVVNFESHAAHDAYQVHPIHRAFVDNFNARWERVQIYDAV